MEAKIGLDLETLRNTTTHQSFQPSSTQEDFYRALRYKQRKPQ